MLLSKFYIQIEPNIRKKLKVSVQVITSWLYILGFILVTLYDPELEWFSYWMQWSSLQQIWHINNLLV